MNKLLNRIIIVFLSFVLMMSTNHNSYRLVKAEIVNPTYFRGYGSNMTDDQIHDLTVQDEYNIDDPAITFVVHGQDGNASHWSNDLNFAFNYDENSLIDKLRLDSNNANVYYAQVSKRGMNNKDYNSEDINYISDRFILKKLNPLDYTSFSYVSEFSEITKHSIVIFESSCPNSYHRVVFDELHMIIDRISYDYFVLSGKLPSINLISHSRGGIISMMYATGYTKNGKIDKVQYIYNNAENVTGYMSIGDGMHELITDYSVNGQLIYSHPFNVKNLYSIGTPYSGTELNQEWARSILDNAFSNESAKNILDLQIQNELLANWNNAIILNPNLRLYANAGEISLNYVLGMLLEEREDIINQINSEEFSVDEMIVDLDILVSKFAYEMLPLINSILDAIGSFNFSEANELIIPLFGRSLNPLITLGVLIEIPALRIMVDQLMIMCNEFLNEHSIEGKLIYVVGMLLSIYDLLDRFKNNILAIIDDNFAIGFDSIGGLGDLFISTNSQLAINYPNVIRFTKTFYYEGLEVSRDDNGELFYSYTYRNFNNNKKSIKAVAIPHNLEIFDSEIQNQIRDNIVLESLGYRNNLELELLEGSSRGDYKIRVKNIYSKTGTIIYNERMCYENDAREFEHLSNLRSFKLSPNGERIINIRGNGNAGYIALAFSFLLPTYDVINISTYTNGLDASNLTMHTPKTNLVSGGMSINADLVPNYVEFEVIDHSLFDWTIKLKNTNEEDISVTYNSKMCFNEASRNFYGLRDLVDIIIPANGERIVTIEKNGTSRFITAAVNYIVDGVRYRRVSSANGLSNDGNLNDIRTTEIQVVSTFPGVVYEPAYASMEVTSRSGFIYYTWGINIWNHNSFPIEVSYNAKMCFEGDAKEFTGLSNIVTISIPADSYKNVTITHNGTAGWIVCSINYSYRGYEYRRITYANGLNINPNRTNSPKYNEKKFTF